MPIDPISSSPSYRCYGFVVSSDRLVTHSDQPYHRNVLSPAPAKGRVFLHAVRLEASKVGDEWRGSFVPFEKLSRPVQEHPRWEEVLARRRSLDEAEPLASADDLHLLPAVAVGRGYPAG